MTFDDSTAKFVPALVDGVKGRKLVILKTYAEYTELYAKYPQSSPEVCPELSDWPAVDVYRAFVNYMRGEDGLAFCRRMYGY